MNKLKYDLSNPQKSILLTEKFHPNTCVANVCGNLEIQEEIDIEAMKKAVNLSIENNEALRIHLVNDGEEIRQIVTDYSNVEIEVAILDEENTLEKLEEKVVQKPFNLIESDLYNFVIYKKMDGTGGLIANLHHIIADAWTVSLLNDKIMNYYVATLKNEEIVEEKYTYLDFIQAEKDYLASSKMEKSKEFWKNQFQELTFSYLKDIQTNSYEAKRKTFILSQNKIDKINKFCKENKTSVFSLWMSVLSIYLAKLNNVKNAIIGSPILNRINFKEKNTMGMYVSTVPYNIEVSKHSKVTYFINDVTKQSFSILRNQKYPYSMLLDSIRKKFNVSKNLYDVALSYQNARDNRKSCKVAYSSRWVFNHTVVNNLDIHICDFNDTGIINLNYDYKTDIFTEEEIELLHKRLISIIDQIIENPEKTVNEIEILCEEEKKYILKEYNSKNSQETEFKSVYEMFKKQIEQKPEHLAVCYKNKQLSYKELDNLANYIAELLQKNGVQKNDVICLAFNDTIEFVASIIATQKVGACYVPIDIKYPTERIQYIIEQSRAKLVLKKPETLENLAIPKKQTLEVNLETTNLNETYPEIETTIEPSDLAYMIYTSGSTGKPKGVKISHQSLANYISWAIKQYVGEETTNFPLFTSVAFDLTVTSIYTPLCSGNTIYIYKNENASLLLKEMIEDKKVQIIKLTPSYLSLLQDIDLKESIVTKFILGGDILQKEICSKITNKFTHPIHIYNEYGPTEATVGCMIYEYSSNDNYASVPIGKPIENTQIYLLNSELELVPLGQLGEMYIGGKCLAKGYTDEEKTNEKFIENPFIEGEKLYKTGDLAKLYPNGNMEYFGRIDFQVKLNGYRIELGEIQSVLLTHPLIKDAYAIVLENEGHKVLCAYYVAEKEISHLDQYIADMLPNYMLPSHLIKVNNIPLTINGKVDTSKLPTLKREEKLYESPKNELEKILQKVFTELLKLDSSISVTENFFDYYMDSLLLIKAQSILFSKGINTNTQNFYDYKTIRDLSNFLLETHEEIAYLNNKEYPDIKTITHKIESASTNYSNIVLFGATGFLGIHILYNLLLKTNIKIYCVIRKKNDTEPIERIKNKLKFYFPKRDMTAYLDKIEIIAGNILEDDFGITKQKYQEIGEKADCVVDAAAIVKHYGDYSIFNQTNVNGTSRILGFCKQFKVPLHYISTMSVSGFGLVDTPNVTFDETNLYIGQKYDKNVYVRSKFEAEKLILEACKNDGLIASIYRVGTITNRFEDGVFQENYEENAFLNRLSAFFSLGAVPNELLEFLFEFTPVDYCANFVAKLVNEQEHNVEVYHLFNNNYVTCKELISMLQEIGINIEAISMEEFKSKLAKSNSNYFGITNYIANTFNNSNPCLKNEKTNNKLQRLELSWPKIDLLYITKILEFMERKKLIGGTNDENK